MTTMTCVKASQSSRCYRFPLLVLFLWLSCSVEESLSFAVRKQLLDYYNRRGGHGAEIYWNRASPSPSSSSFPSSSSAFTLPKVIEFSEEEVDDGDDDGVRPQRLYLYRAASKFLSPSPGGQTPLVADKKSVGWTNGENSNIRVNKVQL